MMGTRKPGVWLAAGVCLLIVASHPVTATPVVSKDAPLPVGTELNEERLDRPTELFNFEAAGGKRSYLFNLGDMLFSSPAIFGGVARDAQMSCDTCHQAGSNNAKLFVPGLSRQPGTFDVTGGLFNPKANNGVFDPVTPPSLRGAKYLAPYGHDGRFASLRDFIRNVVVNEFAGAEPSGEVLDALVTYVREISFLPNRKLGTGGKLTDKASAAARRGEVLFNKPFRHDGAMSCGGCHKPDGVFVDHQMHDIGTGGWFKTKTLINANLNAPYFHDGRYDTYDQVVDYFDKHYELGLSVKEKSDLVAYLDAVGDADEPVTRNSVQLELDEISDFASVLDTAIPARNKNVIALAVESVGNEWRELGEKFPSLKDTSVHGGGAERLKAHGAARDMVLTLRRIAMMAEAGNFEAAARAYADYRAQEAGAGGALKQAEAWSLFNPAVRAAHFAALRRLAELAK